MSVIAGLLLAGLGGALLATVVQFWFQRIRLKADVMEAVISWVDEVVQRTIDLQSQQQRIYSSRVDPWQFEDFRENYRELRIKLGYSEVAAKIALVYGEGDELGLFNRLRKELRETLRTISTAKRETWDQVSEGIDVLFKDEINPLRDKLLKMLLKKATLPKWLLKMGF